MGSSIEYPGDSEGCIHCFYYDGPFWPSLTPQFVQVTFTGIEKGPGWVPELPPPPNGLYEYEQDEPCIWRLDTELHHGTFQFMELGTLLSFSFPGIIDVFSGSGAICVTSIDNTNPGWPAWWTGGSGSVDWFGKP